MKDADKIFKEFSDFVNQMNTDKEFKQFAKKLISDHRTLQQNAFKLFLQCIHLWAEQPGFDDRNEATIRLSKRIVETVRGEYIPFI